MKIKTGQTVYEVVISVDNNNVPQPGATFTTVFIVDGTVNNSITPTVQLSNAPNAIFNISFSANTYGTHQFYAKNTLTNVIYISDSYEAVPDEQVDISPTIYVGL